MRRLDTHPLRKLRNPGRHLRALSRWPDRIVAHIPDAGMLEGSLFWNFKVDTYSKLVEPPHATPETRHACIAALFAAAAAIEASPRRPPGVRVACLVTTPWLFESEVTLFTDEDYFSTFLPSATPATKRTHHAYGWVEGSPASADDFPFELPDAPPGLQALGGVRIVEFDEDWPDRLRDRTNWVWAFPRR